MTNDFNLFPVLVGANYAIQPLANAFMIPLMAKSEFYYLGKCLF